MVEFGSVVKRYGAVMALDGVSFSIKEGECAALLGPNGAGKTTLVRILLDFTRATAGTVTVDGVASADPRARAGVGYLPENLRMPLHLSPLQYLCRCAGLIGIPKGAAEGACREAIVKVGMQGRENAPLRTCSKGMAQRIGLAAAMLGSPRLLILDEPTSGLDPIGIREVRLILEELKGRGMTILLNSHLLSEVEKVCDSAVIVNRGRVLVKDTIAAIARDGESLEDVFVRLVKGQA